MVQENGEQGADPLLLLLSRSGSGLLDHKVLLGPIGPLGLQGLYLGNDNYIRNYEGFQSNIWSRCSVPRIRIGNWSRYFSWLW